MSIEGLLVAGMQCSEKMRSLKKQAAKSKERIGKLKARYTKSGAATDDEAMSAAPRGRHR